MEELTAILQLAGKYGAPAFFIGGAYLIIKLTTYIITMINRVKDLDTQVQLNKSRISALEREVQNLRYEREDFGDI